MPMESQSIVKTMLNGAPLLITGVEDGRLRRYGADLANNSWEHAVICSLREALAPGDFFLDVGAYLGIYSILASRVVGVDGRVVALEPDAAVRRGLIRTLELNEVTDIEVLPIAIAGGKEWAPFLRTEDSMSRLATHGQDVVSTETLESLFAFLRRKPDVIKIDIEGGEVALAPMVNLLREVRFGVLEVHVPAFDALGVDLEEFLRGLGPTRVLQRKNDRNFHVAFGRAER
jgi:FkbM family methyltransferase